MEFASDKLKDEYFIVKHKSVFLIFIVLFTISLLITLYQFTVWKDSPDRTYWNSFALFSGDEPSYLEITSTILHHGSLNTDYFYKDPNHDSMLIEPQMNYEVDSCRLHHSLLGRDGHCWSSHQPGLPFLLFPGYAVGGAVGAMISMNILFSVQGIVIFKFLKKFVKNSTSMICALIFSLTTISLSFSDRIYPDFVAGFFIFSSLYFFFIRENNFKNLAVTGLLLGFLPFLKTEFAIFSAMLLPIMIISMLQRGNRRGTLILASFFLVFTLLFVWYLVISSPVENAPGFGGNYTQLAKNTFSTKIDQMKEFLSKGWANLLFGQSYGLFIFSPLALLSLFGMKYVWQYSKDLTGAIVIMISLFVLGLSVTIPYAAGWTLPSRYVLPILPLTAIPFALLFEKFFKRIIFHIPIILVAYVGVSSNILLSRIIYAHPISQIRADIANQVYFGASKIFPYVNEDIEKYSPPNFWNNVGPFFWIFLGILVTLFVIFTLNSLIRKKLGKLSSRQRRLTLLVTLVLLTLISVCVYVSIREYTIELEITQIYNNDLGRDPDPAGMATWKNAMLNEGKSYQWVEDMIKNSPEGKTSGQITELYHKILGRDPDPAGMATWKNAMLNEGKSYQWVEDMIKNSLEANDLNK